MADQETELVELCDFSIEELRAMRGVLDDAIDVMLKQVDRPRVNLGGNGPPGRID